MKVLIIHNFHRTGSASGDDQVFVNETKLLKQNGVNVATYSVCNDEFDKKNIFGKFALTLGMIWSFKYYKVISKIIKNEKPDIMHVHTFFPLLSPSILYAAKKYHLKVIATLHDTRFICPCATSLRNNHICNKCSNGNYINLIRYGCFKNSRISSMAVAFIFKFHRILKSFYWQIDRYICLNDTQINLMIAAGFDKNKIIKKYNFIDDRSEESTLQNIELPKRYVVFFGRVGIEKGVKEIVKVWNKLDDIDLVIMGDGPLSNDIALWASMKKNVFFMGYTEHKKCIEIVRKAQFVIAPSVWYEGCSMVFIESECLGKAIVTYDIGFLSEAVKDGYNGYKVKLYDVEKYAICVKKIWEDTELCKEMGINARKDYELKYTPKVNFMQLIKIYEELIEE